MAKDKANVEGEDTIVDWVAGDVYGGRRAHQCQGGFRAFFQRLERRNEELTMSDIWVGASRELIFRYPVFQLARSADVWSTATTICTGSRKIAYTRLA